MHSFLGVPIVGRRGVFGNLYLTEKIGAEAFTDEDEHIAVLLAAITAAAVENARLHEESARLLEEVQQLHRTRERFFAMVNHELRNALAAVYGWAEMLVRKKDPATVPRAAFEVLDSAQQAIGLINDLLDLSRLDEDRLKPVIRAVEPASVARRAIGRITPAAEARADPPRARTRPPTCRAARPTPAGWSRSWSTCWATPSSIPPRRARSGWRSPPATAWSGTRSRTRGRAFPRARSSGSSTSTSPRPAGRAEGPGWACPSPGAWPGCWGRAPGGAAARRGWAVRAGAAGHAGHHEELFTKSSEAVQT